MSTSSIVFVGSGFQRQLFDEHNLFPEPMAKDYVAIGQIGQYSYGGNTYTFAVLADRIVLNHNSDTVLSDELIAAAGHVADALQAQNQRGHGVTGRGSTSKRCSLRATAARLGPNSALG